MFGLWGKKATMRRASKKVEQQVVANERMKAADKRVKEINAEIKKEKKGQKFGGYTVSFKNQDTTLEKLFGDKPVTTPDMTKKLWAHIKKNKLGGK